ncbi:MAG: hypothetical protein ACR2HN_13725 [Tepidiformaceae bacterium]
MALRSRTQAQGRRPWTAMAVVALLAAPLLAFAVISRVPPWDPMVMAPTAHFYLVSGATLLSAAIGGGLLLGVTSLRQTRTLFLALGFVTIALVFATHGLSTPGFIVPVHEHPYAVIISAGLSQVGGATFIFVAVLPERWLPGRWLERWGAIGSGLALLGLVAFVVVTMGRRRRGPSSRRRAGGIPRAPRPRWPCLGTRATATWQRGG